MVHKATSSGSSAIGQAGATVIGARAHGTKLYGFPGKEVAFTRQEILQARKRYLKSEHVKGFGKKRVKRATRWWF